MHTRAEINLGQTVEAKLEPPRLVVQQHRQPWQEKAVHERGSTFMRVLCTYRRATWSTAAGGGCASGRAGAPADSQAPAPPSRTSTGSCSSRTRSAQTAIRSFAAAQTISQTEKNKPNSHAHMHASFKHTLYITQAANKHTNKHKHAHKGTNQRLEALIAASNQHQCVQACEQRISMSSTMYYAERGHSHHVRAGRPTRLATGPCKGNVST